MGSKCVPDIYGPIWIIAGVYINTIFKMMKHWYPIFGFGLEEYLGMKEYNQKFYGGAKPNCRRFQQSTLSRKVTFKAPALRLKDKLIVFRRQDHAAELVKKCESISKFVVVNYSHIVPDMVIKKDGEVYYWGV